MRLSKKDKAWAEELYEQVQSAQTAFWDKAQQLESLLGVDIDTNWDLSDVSLKAIRSRTHPDGGHWSRR